MFVQYFKISLLSINLILVIIVSGSSVRAQEHPHDLRGAINNLNSSLGDLSSDPAVTTTQTPTTAQTNGVNSQPAIKAVLSDKPHLDAIQQTIVPAQGQVPHLATDQDPLHLNIVPNLITPVQSP